MLEPVTKIIHDLQTPIDEVEHIFGEVIAITEDIINQLIALVKSMENLFSASDFESVFINPLKSVVLELVNSAEALVALMQPPSLTGFAADAKVAVDAAYSVMAGIINKLIADMSNLFQNVFVGVERGIFFTMTASQAVIERIENDIKIIKKNIANSIVVVHRDETNVVSKFEAVISKTTREVESSISKVGAITTQTLDGVYYNVKNRLANEQSAFDFLIIGLVVSVLFSIIITIMMCKSMILIVVIMIVLAITPIISHFLLGAKY